MFGLGVGEPEKERQDHDECHMLRCMARNAVLSGRSISSREKWSDDRVTLTGKDVALPDVQQANPRHWLVDCHETGCKRNAQSLELDCRQDGLGRGWCRRETMSGHHTAHWAKTVHFALIWSEVETFIPNKQCPCLQIPNPNNSAVPPI